MVTMIFWIFFAAAVAFSALVGLVRGLNKSVIRIVTLVLAVALTFVIAGPLTTYLVQTVQLEGQTLGEMVLSSLSEDEMIAMMLQTAPLLREAILVAPAFVLSIVVFPLVFLVLKFITWIIFLCVQRPLRRLIFKDSCNKEDAAAQPTGIKVGKRLGGMGVGIITGAIIFGMIMTPFFGLFSILPSKSAVDNALDAMVEQNMLQAADVAIIEDAYGITDHSVVKFYGLVGLSSAGRAYINSVSKIQLDGQTMYLADEFDSLLNIVQTALESNVLQLLQAAEDPAALYAMLGDQAFLDTFMQNLFSSKLLCSAIPEVMAMAVESVADGLNVPANKDAVYDNMMADISSAVKNADIDFAAIAAYEKANGLASTFARSASYKNTSKDTVTKEEYEAQIQKLTQLATTISSILDKALSGDTTAFADSVADQIVNQVKTQASTENFDAATVQNTIANLDATNIDAGEGDAAALLEQLTDKEKFETDVATVETITQAIRESVENALADEEKAAETASTLANVVSNLASAVASATDENGNLDATKLDFEKIADAVTELQNSTLKDVGSSVLDLVAAGDLGNNAMVGDVLGAVKEGYEKGEDIGGTITTAGALINLGSAMNGNDSDNQQAMVSSLTDLINNLNDFTISLLPSILSTDTITSMGVPAEYAQAAFSVVETLLKELMKLKGAEDYTSEVNSILALYNLATSGVEEFTEDDIAGLVNYAIESDAVFNTLVSVSTSNPFGIQIPDDARDGLIDGIEKHYNASGKTEREKAIYTAVATLLGLEEEVKLK